MQETKLEQMDTRNLKLDRIIELLEHANDRQHQ